METSRWEFPTRGFLLCEQLAEQRKAFLDGFVFDTVAQPEVAGTTKAVTGNDQKIQLLGFF